MRDDDDDDGANERTNDDDDDDDARRCADVTLWVPWFPLVRFHTEDTIVPSM